MFLRRDFLHVGPIRDDTVLNGTLQLVAGRSGRSAAPVANAAGEVNYVADLQGSHHSSAQKKAANLFEQKHLRRRC